MDNDKLPAWLSGMTIEDLGFIRRFLLASGSLKQIANEYDISYPTVRLRVDRIIEKIKLYENHAETSDFERKIRGLHVDGKIDYSTLSDLLKAYRKETGNHEG